MISTTIFSFFSGSGFLDLGFEKKGFEIGLVNEINKDFTNAYIYSRKLMKLNDPKYGYMVKSIDDLNESQQLNKIKIMVDKEKELGKNIGFIGGPPCPDFSVAGKNKGQEGDNGRLSQSYVNLICEIKPTFFLFENVKGLWKNKKHRKFFEELKKQISEAGYIMTEKLINSIEYGVPQDRDRIILFGVLSDSLINNITQTNLYESFQWDLNTKYPNRSAFEFNWPSTNGDSSFPTKANAGVPEDLTIDYWFKKNSVNTHLNSQDVFKAKAGLTKFMTVLEGDVSKKSYKRLHRFRYSPTAAYGNNEVHIHPTEPHRITVSQALSIQSMPKEFCLPPEMTLTNKFKTIGNGVPYLAAYGLAETIDNFLKKYVK